MARIRKPKILLMAPTALGPRRRTSGPPNQKKSNTESATPPIPMIMPRYEVVLSTCAASAMTTPIAPGPDMSGMASGVREMSSFSCASWLSSGVMRACEVTMPQAVLATISPPAIFRTGSEMPKKYSTKRPKKRNVTRMTNTHRPVFTAVFRRSSAVQDEVMLKKMGIPPKGSTMGNRARNVAAAECGSVRRNCPRAWAEVTGMPPALWLHAPALRSELPTAGARARRPPYREPNSLLESPPPRTRCIRPEHKWHGETRDGGAILQATTERARRRAAPGSTARNHAADSFASTESLLLHPENASQPRPLRSYRAHARRIYSRLFSWLHPGKQQSLFHILRSRRAARRHRPCARPPGQTLSPSPARKRNPGRQTS